MTEMIIQGKNGKVKAHLTTISQVKKQMLDIFEYSLAGYQEEQERRAAFDDSPVDLEWSENWWLHLALASEDSPCRQVAKACHLHLSMNEKYYPIPAFENEMIGMEDEGWLHKEDSYKVIEKIRNHLMSNSSYLAPAFVIRFEMDYEIFYATYIRHDSFNTGLGWHSRNLTLDEREDLLYS